MNEYETEEQQVEALKRWWKENGGSLIIGLMLGLSALFGWRYYDQQQEVHAQEASVLYLQLASDVSMQAVNDETLDLHNRLINEFSDTPYAALSSLALARHEYIAGNTGQALAQLELATQHASDEVLRQVSSLRLARLYIEQKQYAMAESLLQQEHPAAYNGQYEELKGDLYQAQGQLELAAEAYDRAVGLRGFQGRDQGKWLKLKRDNLGLAPGSETAAVTESGVTAEPAETKPPS